MKFSKYTVILAWWVTMAGCTAASPDRNQVSEHQRIAHQYLIIDTHIDVPFRLNKQAADVSGATEDGDFDYPRARVGGLNAPFMSIYIPAAVDEAGDAFAFAEDSIASVKALATAHPDKFALATCTRDIYDHLARSLISLPMGMENGGPIGGSFENLAHFYHQGIRYITLAHAKSNHISDSSYDPNEHWQGLSEFGKNLIGEMNRVGVIIDVSHISDKAFWQVMALTATPVIASHSSLRHFTPDFQRNMSDDMVAAMAAAGGVIQINFGSSFLHQASRDYSNTRLAIALEYQLANHLADDDPALKTFVEAYNLEHPYPYASLQTVLDHIDRVVEIAGINAVGIGSDFDGVGDTLPTDLKDVSTYPTLIQGLRGRGYNEADIAKILGGNTMRVWQAIEQHATEEGTELKCASG